MSNKKYQELTGKCVEEQQRLQRYKLLLGRLLESLKQEEDALVKMAEIQQFVSYLSLLIY